MLTHTFFFQCNNVASIHGLDQVDLLIEQEPDAMCEQVSSCYQGNELAQQQQGFGYNPVASQAQPSLKMDDMTQQNMQAYQQMMQQQQMQQQMQQQQQPQYMVPPEMFLFFVVAVFLKTIQGIQMLCPW